MEEMLEFNNGLMENSENTELLGMYKQAYETALKDGANDMAEFYKHKLNSGSEISFGSRSVDMSSDDAKRYNKLEQEYEKASKTYKNSVKNDDMELTYSKNNEKIMEKTRSEMEKIENKYR